MLSSVTVPINRRNPHKSGIKSRSYGGNVRACWLLFGSKMVASFGAARPSIDAPAMSPILQSDLLPASRDLSSICERLARSFNLEPNVVRLIRFSPFCELILRLAAPFKNRLAQRQYMCRQLGTLIRARIHLFVARPTSNNTYWDILRVLKEDLMLRVIVMLVLFCTAAKAETVDVKYRGVVDLKPFTCKDAKSSFIDRTCYDAKRCSSSLRALGITIANYPSLHTRNFSSRTRWDATSTPTSKAREKTALLIAVKKRRRPISVSRRRREAFLPS